MRAALLTAEARIAALEQIIHSLKRARFGQSAERIDAALTDVLEQMVSGKVNSRSLAALLPWAWHDAKRAELAA